MSTRQRGDDQVAVRLRELWDVSAEEGAARSTADAIYDLLVKAIVERVLPPGWRLREEYLATLLGVSRTPVREALMRLAVSNLVSRDDRGTLRVEELTAQRVLDIYAVRVALERLSARLAATAAGQADVLRLEQLNERCAEAARAGDFSRMSAENILFHQALAQSTRNETLIQFIEQTYNWVRMHSTTTLAEANRASIAVQEHADLIRAVAERDADGAEAIAERHIREAEAIRVANLSRRG